MNPSALHTFCGYVADSLWLSQCADAIDRERETGNRDVPHPGAGGDWQDMRSELGPIPQRFHRAAAQAIGSVPLPTLTAGLDAWQRLTDGDAERFGHLVAMVMLDSGVGLLDHVRTSTGATAQDRADVDTVRRLSRALPRIGEWCTLFLFWNPNTRRCE